MSNYISKDDYLKDKKTEILEEVLHPCWEPLFGHRWSYVSQETEEIKGFHRLFRVEEIEKCRKCGQVRKRTYHTELGYVGDW